MENTFLCGEKFYTYVLLQLLLSLHLTALGFCLLVKALCVCVCVCVCAQFLHLQYMIVWVSGNGWPKTVALDLHM